MSNVVYCTEQVLKAKNVYIQRMTNKSNDTNKVPKTHWSILNRFYTAKRYQPFLFHLLMVYLFQIFV